MKERKRQEGITLVALVITVIVLIILAGVTLSTLVGDNGIITKAQEAKQNMANAAAEEDKLIQNLLNEIKGIEAGGEEIEVPEGTIEFGEVTWSNGQAEVEILANTAGETLQYQVNGTEEGNWEEIGSGEKVTGLHHGDEVHARLWNGSIASVNKSTTIKDEKAPEVKVAVGEVTSNSIAVTVEVKEEESGLVETETYQYYLGEALAGKSTNNSYKYEGLEQEKEYNLVVKVQDKAGNEGEGSTTATTEGVPTIETTLSEGKYVWYTDANGTQQKCIVLYGPENEKYNSYGIQIITADTVTDSYTLGVQGDFNASRNSYNNVITTLNAEAEKYRKKDDEIVELARCVGSVPDNPNSEAGMHNSSYSYMARYNNTLKDADTNYDADYKQMQSIVINGQGIHNIGKKYWLASRYVIAHSSNSDFYVRYVYASGTLSLNDLCIVNSGGSTYGNSRGSGLRLVFRLKSGIKVTGGDGSEGNPYTLAP